MTGFKIRPYQLDCFKPSSFEKFGQGQAEKQNWAQQDMTARQSHRISRVVRPTGGLAAAEMVPMVRQNAAASRCQAAVIRPVNLGALGAVSVSGPRT